MASDCGPGAGLRSVPCERPCHSFPAFCSAPFPARRAGAPMHSASAANSLSRSAATASGFRAGRDSTFAVLLPPHPVRPTRRRRPNRGACCARSPVEPQKSGRGRRWQKEFSAPAAARSDARGRSPFCSTGNASYGLRAATGPAKDGGLSRCRSMHESGLGEAPSNTCLTQMAA